MQKKYLCKICVTFQNIRLEEQLAQLARETLPKVDLFFFSFELQISTVDNLRKRFLALSAKQGVHGFVQSSFFSRRKREGLAELSCPAGARIDRNWGGSRRPQAQAFVPAPRRLVSAPFEGFRRSQGRHFTRAPSRSKDPSPPPWTCS